MRKAKLRTSASLLIVPMILLGATLTASAQEAVPMLINYEGELRGSTTGDPVPDGPYSMRFQIYDVETGGIHLWEEIHSTLYGNAVEVTDGVFSVLLGSGTGDVLTASIFNGPARWLQIRVETETMSPRQRITSSAYSIISENSRLLGGREPSEYLIQAQGLRLQPTAASPNIVGGHGDNAVTSGVVGATIGGGGASTTPNLVTDDYGTVGGGGCNQAGNNAGTATDADGATVGGGWRNTASGDSATVGGGHDNIAANSYTTVGGGSANKASNWGATVGGGVGNEVWGWDATVGGGAGNEASNMYATVPGGCDNAAGGMYSFAAGRRAKANHHGSFVWADSTDADFASVRQDHFHVKASGGVGLNVNGGWVEIWVRPGDRLIDTSTLAHLTTGGVWTNGSDRNAKENFAPVDERDVLARLAEVPITTWNHKAEDTSTRHMGPMAQDFHAAFGLGGNDKTIGTIDADGVALAAIKGLHEIVQEKDAKISSLESRIAALETLVESLVGSQGGGE